jgi:hypothetical protein
MSKQLLTTFQKTTREQNNENNNIMKPFIFPLNGVVNVFDGVLSNTALTLTS